VRLKAWRAQRLWTQQHLADSSGVSIFTIRAIEGGKHLPSVATSRKLAEALEADPADIDEVAEAIDRASKKDLVGTSPTR